MWATLAVAVAAQVAGWWVGLDGAALAVLGGVSVLNLGCVAWFERRRQGVARLGARAARSVVGGHAAFTVRVRGPVARPRRVIHAALAWHADDGTVVPLTWLGPLPVVLGPFSVVGVDDRADVRGDGMLHVSVELDDGTGRVQLEALYTPAQQVDGRFAPVVSPSSGGWVWSRGWDAIEAPARIGTHVDRDAG